MADWQAKLDISDVVKKFQDGEIPISKMGTIIADRIGKLKSPSFDEWINQEKDDVQEGFNNLQYDEDSTVDDFNDRLEALYDWADSSVGDNRKKACWVTTAK